MDLVEDAFVEAGDFITDAVAPVGDAIVDVGDAIVGAGEVLVGGEAAALEAIGIDTALMTSEEIAALALVLLV